METLAAFLLQLFPEKNSVIYLKFRNAAETFSGKLKKFQRKCAGIRIETCLPKSRDLSFQKPIIIT